MNFEGSIVKFHANSAELQRRAKTFKEKIVSKISAP